MFFFGQSDSNQVVNQVSLLCHSHLPDLFSFMAFLACSTHETPLRGNVSWRTGALVWDARLSLTRRVWYYVIEEIFTKRKMSQNCNQILVQHLISITDLSHRFSWFETGLWKNFQMHLFPWKVPYFVLCKWSMP